MEVGFSLCDITPGPGIYLTGYGHPERLADGVHLPLEATVMVLRENGVEAAVLGLDWCFVDWPLAQEIRAAIRAAAGIPETNILCCCSHTHSAPHTTFMRTIGRTAVDPENKGVQYVRDMIPRLADAVRQAKANLWECAACFAAGRTEVGISRRSVDENGQVSGMAGDPDAIRDPYMTAVRFADRETGRDLGILVHCGAHNTAMGLDRKISSDWCGVMKRRIRDTYPVPVLYLNGAEGDVGPRTNRWLDIPGCPGFSAGAGDGPKSAEEVGYRAASDALRLLENMRDFRTDLPLAVRTGELRLPQKLSMTQEEAENLTARYAETPPEGVLQEVECGVAKTVLEAWKRPPEPELVLEQTVVAFGPVALTPFPFEMFSIFSLRLRKYGPFEYTLLVSQVNGRNAYLPDRGSFAMGGYEPECLKTIRPYVVEPHAGDVAIRQSLALLRKMR